MYIYIHEKYTRKAIHVVSIKLLKSNFCQCSYLEKENGLTA